MDTNGNNVFYKKLPSPRKNTFSSVYVFCHCPYDEFSFGPCDEPQHIEEYKGLCIPTVLF